MGPGGKAPTKEERRWISACREFGCVACFIDGNEGVPPDIHHIVEANRRLGHRFTIPLCPAHHQADTASGKVSLHPGKSKRFIRLYGTERHLLYRLETRFGFDHVESA